MRPCDKENCNKQASKRFEHKDLYFCSANCRRQVVNAVVLKEEKPKRKRKAKKVEEKEDVIES